MTINGSRASALPMAQSAATRPPDSVEFDAITRRGLLKALAATPLAGCWADAADTRAAGGSGELGQPNSGTVNPEGTADAAGALEPEWVGAIPSLTFTKGTPMAYDLVRHTVGFKAGEHEMVLAASSTPLSGGVTLDPAGRLVYDGVESGASLSGIVIDIRDISLTTGTVTVSAVAGLVPFAARIASPGVVRHFSFAEASHIGAGPNGFGYGHNYGWYAGADNNKGANALDHPVIDTVVHPPTSEGSLRVTMTETLGGGLWVTNFSNDLQTRFTAGDEFFIQWRQRFNAAMLGPNVEQVGSWKQCLISDADIDYSAGGVAGSCECSEICLTSSDGSLASFAYKKRFPIAYHGCPGCAGQKNLTAAHSTEYLLWQNMMPAPFCSYNNTNTGPSGGGSEPPGGNCFSYFPDEWMTFQIGVTCGPVFAMAPWGQLGIPNSRIRVWGQREGRPSVALIDVPVTLDIKPTDTGYGKFWITTRNPYGRVGTWQTWYSELIISRQRIPDAL